MQPKIVFTAYTPLHREMLWNDAARQTAEKFNWNIQLPPISDSRPSDNEWKELFRDADAIITTWGAPKLNAEILSTCPNLRFIGHAAGSVADVISPEVFSRNIRVSTANREMADAVARWGLMMTLFGLRGVIGHAQLGAFSPVRWDARNNGRDARNSVIGIWGYGDIAKSLIRLLRVLEPAQILVCSRSLSEEEAKANGIKRASLEEIFAQSDVVHLFQSLTPQTKGGVTREHLRSMKQDAILINAGRAHLVEHDALVEILREGRITAILDTHYEEPIAPDSPFHGLPTAILTPHCAGKENNYLFVKPMLEEFHRLLHGQPLQHEIDVHRALNMTAETLRRPAAPSA